MVEKAPFFFLMEGQWLGLQFHPFDLGLDSSFYFSHVKNVDDNMFFFSTFHISHEGQMR